MHSVWTRPASRPRGSRPDVALAGALLIASTYGMARFGVGLFAPRLAAERPELAGVVGYTAAAQFVSYAFAAARLCERRPRAGLVLAGATATLGCLGVATAKAPLWFVVAVFVGGMGAGFASPAMVRVVDALVGERAAPTAQSAVNAGTAVGVVAAGVLAFLTTTTAPAWVLMSLVCAGSAGAVLLLARGRGFASASPGTLRRGPGAPDRDARAGAGEGWAPMVVPAVAALVVGAGSALVWTFGPLLATQSGPVQPGSVGWLWVALGVGGLAGPFTGLVVDRLGPRGGWRLCAGVVAVGTLVLAAAVGLGVAWSAFVAMALFGGGYMCLSGVLILWARSVWPTAAATGTAVLFIALAVGQALGSVGFEVARAAAGPTGSILAAAALCALGGAVARLPDRS